MELGLQRQVQNLRIASDKILDKYWKYYKFIYSEKSNEIFDEEHSKGHPSLTIVVVHKEDRMPGKGFFEY